MSPAELALASGMAVGIAVIVYRRVRGRHRTRGKGPIVPASDIGQAAYCGYALYRRRAGVAPDRAARVRMARGSELHRQFNDTLLESAGRGGTRRIGVVLFVLGAIAIVVLWAFSG